jgi:hypothetical protein
VSETVGFIAGYNDMTVTGPSIQQGCRHLGISEDTGSFGEARIGG